MPGMARDVSAPEHFKTGLAAFPNFLQISTDCPSPGMMRPGRRGDHSPVSGTGVKNEWSSTSTPLYDCTTRR